MKSAMRAVVIKDTMMSESLNFLNFPAKRAKSKEPIRPNIKRMKPTKLAYEEELVYP